MSRGRSYKGEYALYKGDDLIDIGTAEELAAKRGVQAETIKFYATPTNARRNKGGKKLTAVRLDD